MLFRNCLLRLTTIGCRFTHTHVELVQKLPEVIAVRELPSDDFIDVQIEKESVLDKCKEDISYVAPYLQPSFNFAAYVNKSETLQQLVKLGVDLYKIEKRPNVPPYILGLDFEKDIKKYILFLSDLGVSVDDLGHFFTKNPFIFKEDIDDLEVRINYLRSKKFKDEMIIRIITRNPYWLNFSTQRIDDRLGFFQTNFSLTGNEVRQLTVQQPKIITYKINHIRVNKFVFLEEMGFSPDETKSILLKKPNLFMKAQDKLLQTFEFVHKRMNVPTERISEFPEVLSCRKFKLEQRYLFLEKLGKVQFNPREPNYVSLTALVSGSDAEFVENVAKASIQSFNMFLKSL